MYVCWCHVRARRTHPFIRQLLAGVLQTFPALLDAPPLIQHATSDIGIDLADAADEPVAHVEVLRHAQEVLPEVRHGVVDERKPVVELLRVLDRLLGIERVRAAGGREPGVEGREAGPSSLTRCWGWGVEGRDTEAGWSLAKAVTIS